MKTILTSLFAAVLCLFLLAGCSSKKAIVGKWQADGAQVEFTDDGKMIMSEGGNSISGTYTLPDDSHIMQTIDIAGNKQSHTVGYKVDGDTLTIDDGGKKESMKRAK